MVTPEDVERLTRFEAQGGRVLSTYLDLDPGGQVKRSYRMAFEDLVKDTRALLKEDDRKAFEAEVVRVQTWLNQQPTSGRATALFSCASRGLWQSFAFQVRVENHLAFEPEPDVAPLAALLDDHERYAVALVDKRHARLFTVLMGEIEETDDFKDFVPGKHDQGGLSQANYQRHHEAHVHWHLKRVVQHLATILRRRPFDRLIMAGPEEATSELRHLLPRVLSSRLVAVIPGEITAGPAELLEKTRAVEQRIEQEVEDHLVQQLREEAGPAGRAILGVAPTLDALWSDMVQILIVAPRRLEGSECPNCERLEEGRIKTCPVCGTTMQSVHDLFHRAMTRTLKQAGRVEVVHGDASRRLHEAGSGMGARLRFKSTASTTPARERAEAVHQKAAS
jgi:peptide chain release factor subunit 1